MPDTDFPPSVRAEALRILGYTDEPEPEIAAEIEDCYADMRRCAVTRALYEIFDISVTADAIEITPTLKLCGASLAKLCKNCRKAVLMAATLGAGVDRLISRAEADSVSRALFIDACASAEIERTCDELEPEIMAKLDGHGDTWLTMRFSPGYGGVEPTESAKILEALNAGRRIGLTLTKSGMLIPIKSVTAVIGIADRPQKRERGCKYCAAAANCPYRKRGAYCGDRS